MHHITFSQHSGYLGGFPPHISSKKQQHRDNRCSILFTHQRSRTPGIRPGSELKVTRERSQNLKRRWKTFSWSPGRLSEAVPTRSRAGYSQMKKPGETAHAIGLAHPEDRGKGIVISPAHLVSSDTPQKPKYTLVGRLSFH